jgi:hypothetical protein
MAKLNVNIGLSVNDKTGDTLRTAFDKINQNFTELYTLTGGTSADLTELAQDYAAPMFNHASHTNITVTYDDANNKILLTGSAAQVQSNWTASSGLGVILNKPTLFSGSYTDLTSKPTIPAAAAWPVTNTSGASGPTKVAIGQNAGNVTQGYSALAIGANAGENSQGNSAVAIGEYTGTTSQGDYAVAVGRSAGYTAQGANAVAIGRLAGYSSQPANTIILNATAVAVNGVAAQTDSFYVSPIRTATATANVLYYNTTTKEITYAAAGSVSSLVNGANTVSLDSNSNLTFTNGEQIKTNFLGGGIELYQSSDNTIGIYPGGAEIKTFITGGPKYKWLFGITGNTTFPTGLVLGAPRGAGTVNFTSAIDKEFQIETGTSSTSKLWRFGTDGLLTLPGNLTLPYNAGIQSDTVMRLRSGTGTVMITTNYEVSNATPHTWTLGTDGSLTFPNATVQTTAWTGSVSSLVNSTKTVSLASTGILTLPNAAVIGQASDIEITAASTSYTNSLAIWEGVRASFQAQATSLGITSTGWPFIAWNATGTTAAGFLSQLTTAMAIQNSAPSSPPTPLIFQPAISAAAYYEIRDALATVRDSYANWQALLTSVKITSGSESVTLMSNGKLIVPNIIQTDPEENLVIRTRYAVVTSPPGIGTYSNVDFTFSTNGSITFPRYDGSTVLNATVQGDSSGNLNLTAGNYVNIESNSYAAITLAKYTANTSVDIGNVTSPARMFGDLQIMTGRHITTNSSSINLINTSATTVNFAGAATTLNMGAAGGITTIAGDLIVNGTTTTINSTTVTVDDKNIELGSTASPTDATADGGGITLKGSTDKTFTYVNATGLWTANIGVQATSFTGLAVAATTASTAASVGYMGLPQSATATTATLAIGDSGKHIYVTTASQTITIPANASVAYPIGTTITFIAGPSATTVSIAIATDTMYLGGTGTTGTRTLAAYGMATAVKVAATTWYINGSGLT